MQCMTRRLRTRVLAWGLSAVVLVPAPIAAHPGSGIVLDRLGQIYFVDMVSGIWKIDTRGVLTHIPGPAFHWMTLDADDRFSGTRLPSGSGGQVVRIGANRTVLLVSSYPVAMGQDGGLYFPSHDVGAPVQLLKMLPSGRTSVLASLPVTTAGTPIRDLRPTRPGRLSPDAARAMRANGHRGVPELVGNQAAVWYRSSDGRPGPVLAAIQGTPGDTWLLPLSAINKRLTSVEGAIVVGVACDVGLPLLAARRDGVLPKGYDARIRLEWVDRSERILRHAERLVRGTHKSLVAATSLLAARQWKRRFVRVRA
jgi:hypothetical protein